MKRSAGGASGNHRSGSETRVTPAPHLGAVLDFMRSLWGISHALESRSQFMKAHFGISGPERMVIRLVGRFPGISAGELARILRVHPSTMTWSLKRLVHRKLLSRRADEKDARRALFSLTAAGSAIDAIRQGTVESSVRAALATTRAEDIRSAASVLEALIRELDLDPSALAHPPSAPARVTKNCHKRSSTLR